MCENCHNGTHGLLFIIDTSIYDVEVSRVNVVNGDLLSPVRFIGKDFSENALRLLRLIKDEKPQKIIFNKVGMSQMFYDRFINLVNSENIHGIGIDAFGNVTYKFFTISLDEPNTFNFTINMNNTKDVDFDEISKEIMKNIKNGNIVLGNGNI